MKFLPCPGTLRLGRQRTADGLQRELPVVHGDEKPQARAAARRERFSV